MKNFSVFFVSAALLLLATGTARAEMYIGGSLGHAATVPAIAEDIVSSWNSMEYGAGYDCETLGCYSDQNASGALKFFLGYQVNPYFAAEGFLSYLGSYDSFASDGWTEAYAYGEIGTLGVAAVGMLPLGSGRVSLLGKIGVHHWSSEGDFSVWDYWVSDGRVGTFDDSGTDFMGGIGVNINFGDHAAMRVEYEFFRAETTNTEFGIGFLSVGGMYRF